MYSLLLRVLSADDTKVVNNTPEGSSVLISTGSSDRVTSCIPTSSDVMLAETAWQLHFIAVYLNAACCVMDSGCPLDSAEAIEAAMAAGDSAVRELNIDAYLPRQVATLLCSHT